jgi:hypothetical protein
MRNKYKHYQAMVLKMVKSSMKMIISATFVDDMMRVSILTRLTCTTGKIVQCCTAVKNANR